MNNATNFTVQDFEPVRPFGRCKEGLSVLDCRQSRHSRPPMLSRPFLCLEFSSMNDCGVLAACCCTGATVGRRVRHCRFTAIRTSVRIRRIVWILERSKVVFDWGRDCWHHCRFHRCPLGTVATRTHVLWTRKCRILIRTTLSKSTPPGSHNRRSRITIEKPQQERVLVFQTTTATATATECDVL